MAIAIVICSLLHC